MTRRQRLLALARSRGDRLAVLTLSPSVPFEDVRDYAIFVARLRFPWRWA